MERVFFQVETNSPIVIDYRKIKSVSIGFYTDSWKGFAGKNRIYQPDAKVGVVDQCTVPIPDDVFDVSNEIQ